MMVSYAVAYVKRALTGHNRSRGHTLLEYWKSLEESRTAQNPQIGQDCEKSEEDDIRLLHETSKGAHKRLLIPQQSIWGALVKHVEMQVTTEIIGEKIIVN